jgi:hypothetical protein
MIVKDIQTFKKYVPTVDTAPFEKILPHLIAANGYLERELLGTVLYSELESVGFPEVLLLMCERVVALRAYERAIPFLDLRQTEQGFAVISTDGLVPASKDRVKALTDACRADGDASEDNLLSFLESLSGPLKDDWLGSDVCTYLTDTYISTFREFKRYMPVQSSEYPAVFPSNSFEFRGLWGSMRNAIRFKIEPDISHELSMQLMSEIREKSLTAVNVRIVEPVRFALVAFALGIKGKGSEYMGQVLTILRDNPDDYPLWKNSSVGEAVINRLNTKNDGSIFWGAI